MSGKLGSRLAQLANAKKQAGDSILTTTEDLERAEAATTAAHSKAIQLILLPHVDEFNSFAELPLHLTLEIVVPHIRIKQRGVSLLTLDITPKAAIFKRKAGAYTSDDYFTIGKLSDGAMTFRNYSAEVKRPMNANEFAELVLMEALGLNE